MDLACFAIGVLIGFVIGTLAARGTEANAMWSSFWGKATERLDNGETYHLSLSLGKFTDDDDDDEDGSDEEENLGDGSLQGDPESCSWRNN